MSRDGFEIILQFFTIVQYSGSQPFIVCGPLLKALNTRGPLLSKKFSVCMSFVG